MIYDFSVAAWPPGRPLFFCQAVSAGFARSVWESWMISSIYKWMMLGYPHKKSPYTVYHEYVTYHIYIFFIYAYIFILSFVYVESDICFCSQKMVHIVYILWYSLILDVYCIIPFVSSISLCIVYNRILYPGVFVLYIYIYIKYY